MPAFRFCRPDDIPLLVRAVNECVLVHCSAPSLFTLQDWMREMGDLDLWPSSCMLSISGDGKEPFAAIIGRKRATATLIRSLGVRPDMLGQGHGTHLLESLLAKLAVLGPS